MIDFKSFFDFTKLPTKIFVVTALASGVFLFIPETFTKALHFDKFKEYAGYIGIVFVFSCIFILVNFIIWVYQKIEYKIRLKKIKNELKQVLENLDPREKAVLREFAIQGQNSIKMPYDDTVVSGLIHRGILKYNKQLGNSFVANGNKVSLSLSKYIEELITPEQLDLSMTMTEEEKEKIQELRPAWTREWRY
jgi:hypothetical protein